KVFSVPSEEPEITQAVLDAAKNEFNKESNSIAPKHKLSVKVNNYDQAKLCIALNTDRIYLASDVLLPDSFMSLAQLQHLVSIKGNTEIYLALPQMMDELQFDIIDQYLHKHGHLFDGVLATNLGAIKRCSNNFKLITDYNLNLYNHKAVEFYKSIGAQQFTASIEAKVNELSEFLAASQEPIELIVHGPVRVMYLDHNVYDNLKDLQPSEAVDNRYVNNDVLVMLHEKGENPVYIDHYNKNHLFISKELCLLPILEHLSHEELLSLRIEGQTYSLEELKYVIETYQKAAEDISSCSTLYQEMKSCRAGFTLGALSYKFDLD
ncbi:MAG TPA: U32 family peptidase, partial [Patescibacteria group bacterium]|nr:U32 family peptidase [Patescibacteria group bacterium]